MDIYSYVNSRDIREYLREKDYIFNSLETAWLIYMNNEFSYEQKKQAWLELVETMPDCEVPCRHFCKGNKSLHETIKLHIKAIDDILFEFNKDDPACNFVYMYSFLYQGDETWTEEYDTVYRTINECIDVFQKEVAELDQLFNHDNTGVLKYRIKKQSLIDKEDVSILEYKGTGEFIDIVGYPRSKEVVDRLQIDVFESLWFDFPTPFKKGDILWIPFKDNQIRWRSGGFVLDSLITWEPLDFIVENGDSSDMNGGGYFVNPDGTIYHEVTGNYMDLEYYNGPYKLNEKILPALSKFIKGEIEIELLLCAYRKVLLDVAADDVMLKNWFTKEILEEIKLI